MPSTSWLKEWAPHIAIGGGMTTAMLAAKALRGPSQEALESTPEYKRKPYTFQKAKKEYGVDVGYSHGGKYQNAQSIPKGSLDEIKDTESQPHWLYKALRKAREHGLVVTAAGYRRPGIVEHEIGHSIAREKGSPWEKFTHGRAADLLYGLSAPAGLVAGMMAGRSYGPIAGALAGLGSSALLSAPYVHGEVIANRYANELLPKDKIRPSTWPFIGSYFNDAITTPTIAGGLMGLLGRR